MWSCWLFLVIYKLIIFSGYPLSKRIDLILSNSNCNRSGEQMVKARWVRVRIRLVLRIYAGIPSFHKNAKLIIPRLLTNGRSIRLLGRFAWAKKSRTILRKRASCDSLKDTCCVRVVNRAGLFGSGSGSGRVRAWLLGKLRAYFGPGTMLTNKLSKTKLFCYLIFILCRLT